MIAPIESNQDAEALQLLKKGLAKKIPAKYLELMQSVLSVHKNDHIQLHYTKLVYPEKMIKC